MVTNAIPPQIIVVHWFNALLPGHTMIQHHSVTSTPYLWKSPCSTGLEYPGVHTCSRYMQFQREHVLSTHHLLQSERVLKSRVPARTVPAGTQSNHVLGTNRPLSTPPKRSLNDVKPRTCSMWAGLSTQTAISAESARKKWPHTLRSVYTISHTAQTEMCADFKSEQGGTENISQCSQSERSCTKNLFREHFAGVVYWEHMNGPYFPLIFKLTFTTKTPLYALSSNARGR